MMRFTENRVRSSIGEGQVRVHADVDGDGKVSRGDYVSTQSYPVDMNAEQSGLAIVAKRVG